MFKKYIFIILAIVSFFTACDLLYPPSFDEKIVDWEKANPPEDPFAEIGRVAYFRGADDSNSMLMKGVLDSIMADLEENYPNDSNSIIIACDFGQSSLHPKNYPDHQPFLLGGFAGYYKITNTTTNFMQSWKWNYPEGDNKDNKLIKSSYHEDIYYIRITPNSNSLATIDVSSNDVFFKFANYLNTFAGLTALSNVSGDDYWTTIGYADLGMASLRITLYRIGDYIIIDNPGISFSPFVTLTNTTACYVTKNRRGIGFKVNNSITDWSLQAAGMSTIPKGTKIRVIWENISTDNLVPYYIDYVDRTSVWTNWPQGACILGNKGYLSENNIAWDNTNVNIKPKAVYVDKTSGRAVITLTLDEAVDRNLIFIMIGTNWGGTNWKNTEEPNKHFALLPDPTDGAMTIYVDANFDYTNIQ